MRLHSFVMFAAITAASGCSGSDREITFGGAPFDLLEPPEPGAGVQYRMTTLVEPFRESYGCRLFVAPPEGLYIHREEVKFSPGGHHILLYRTPYLSMPAHDERGERLDPTSVHDCSDGATSRWRVSGVLGGSESFGGNGLVDELPDGAAIAIKPGEIILMSTHYLNASGAPVEVDSRINLYTLPRDQVKVEAGVLYLDSPIIHVPAHSTSTARMRCPIPLDISIVSLQSHMHRHGVEFGADLVRGAARAEIYSTQSWSEPLVEGFDPPLLVESGSSIEIHCDYESADDRDVERGPTARDEMCQLIGPYFPRDSRIDACQIALGDLARICGSDAGTSCIENLVSGSSTSPFGG